MKTIGMKQILKLPSLVIILFSFSCSPPNRKVEARYQTKFVNGSTNNKIEILDFGGSGEPIIFLAGLGNTAHVFVDFAPKFRDQFHVYAMTRRGYGVSEQPDNGYMIDTLANDILSATKALGLDKVILIGHSYAGDEISKIASTHPEKIFKAVYLDAGYDRSNFMSTLLPYFPIPPNPTSRDSSSLENFKAFYTKLIGIDIPTEEFKNTSVLTNDGKYEKDVTSGEIQGKVMMAVERPDYKNINCPALSIYAISSSVQGFIPFYDLLDEINKKKVDTGYVLFKKMAREQISLFKNEVKNGAVKEIQGAHHYVFISNADETEKLIREFLK